MKAKSSLGLAIAMAALLSACGGDGGTTNPVVDPVPLKITGANESAVARATVAGGFAVGRTSTVSTTGDVFAQSAGRGGVSAVAGAIDGAARAARRAIASASVRPEAVVAAPAETCEGGGTRAATFDDRDNNSVTSAGDVLTVAFARCSSGHVVLDGTMVMTVNLVSASTLAGSMQFQRLAVTTGSVAATITGAADVTETDDASESDVSIVVSGGGLDVALASPSYADAIAFSSGFTIATTAHDDTDRATIALRGSFAATSLPSLDGSLTVDTPEAIVLTSASAYPGAGKLHVVANGGGSLLITVLDTTQVELQLSPDANSPYDAGTVVAWTSLIAP